MKLVFLVSFWINKSISKMADFHFYGCFLKNKVDFKLSWVLIENHVKKFANWTLLLVVKSRQTEVLNINLADICWSRNSRYPNIAIVEIVNLSLNLLPLDRSRGLFKKSTLEFKFIIFDGSERSASLISSVNFQKKRPGV